MDTTAKLLAIVVLTSFATERILAAARYLLDSERLHKVRNAAAAKLRAKERRRVLLLALGGSVALAVVDAADIRILKLMIGSTHAIADYWLTWLVLFAGADRVRSLLDPAKGAPPPAAAKKETPAVRIRVEGGTVHELARAS